MSGAGKARLARVAAVAASADWAEIGERHRLSAIAIIAAAVRRALLALGIDPAGIARLREAEAAEAALAALPDTPELREADDEWAAATSGGDPGALDDFVAETERLARRYASDCTLDLATAPLADLLAWCIAQGAITLQRDGSENLLLICCKPAEQRDAAGADVSNRINPLDRASPPDSTDSREFGC
jgi:hypothetical protein